MQNLLNEFNEPIKGYDSGETYSETICFNYNAEIDEFENSTDLFVSVDEIDFDKENLTDEQINEVENFGEKVQTEIKIYLFECEDRKKTERSLMY